MTVQNSPKNLELIKGFVESFPKTNPQNVQVTAYVIQAPGALLRQLNATQPYAEDQAEMLHRLLAEAGKHGSGVTLLRGIQTSQQSGEPCFLDCVTDREHTYSLTLDANGFASAQNDMQRLGMSLRIDASAESDGHSLGLTLAPEFNVRVRTETSKPRTPGKTQATVQKTAFETTLTMNSGDTRLAGLWPANGDTLPGEHDISQALFVTGRLEVPKVLENDPAQLVMPQDLKTMMTHEFDLPTAMLEAFDASPGGLAKMLTTNGITLPEGSVASLNEAGRMVVKTTPEALTEVDQWTQEMINQAPATVAMTTEIIRGPNRLMRDLTDDAAITGDHEQLLQRLHAAVAQGEARCLHTAHQESRDGEKTVQQSHLSMSLLSEMTRHAHPQPNLFFQPHLTGLAIEITPKVEEDRKTLLLDFDLSYPSSPTRRWKEVLSEGESKPSFSLPRHEFDLARMRGQLVFANGRPQLIGCWQTSGDAEMLDAAFITCRVIRHPGLVDKKSVKLSANRPKAGAPTEFITQTYSMPSNFWTVMDSAALSTPPSDKSKAAVEMLQANGISLPAESQVTYHELNSRLTVKTTWEAMQMVDAMLGGCVIGSNPQRCMLTLHLIQTDRTTANKLLAQQSGRNDLREALQLLLSKKDTPQAKILATLSSCTFSGREIKMQHTQDHPVLSEVVTDENCNVGFEYEPQAIGTTFEGSLSSSPDRLTSTLDYTLIHHPAAPVPRIENIEQAPAAVPMELSDVPTEKVQSSITFMPGTSRILGMWKPIGTPDLEALDIVHMAILETAVLP
ncbi:hypothetical protein GCM10023213_40150 [Prosthecobacter algae]|uniref:Uncharacterized protein n=2 Tax=Prosthecobacter algae TaxID=1144682 RepID=A0ABP9PHE2_9BACT